KAHARHWMILKCSESDASMCDYSLDLVASRPAKVGDKLVKREGRRIPCRRKCPARDQSGHGQVTNRPEAIPMRSLKSAPSDRTSRLARSASSDVRRRAPIRKFRLRPNARCSVSKSDGGDGWHRRTHLAMGP